jgi:hypothetical protein
MVAKALTMIPASVIGFIFLYECAKRAVLSKLGQMWSSNTNQTTSGDTIYQATVQTFFTFMSDIIFHAMMNAGTLSVCTLCFFMFYKISKILDLHNMETRSEQVKARQPIPFNAQNVTLWLQDFEKKWETTGNENDTKKLHKLIACLDPQSQTIVKRREQDKKIQTYNDAVNYLHLLHGGEVEKEADHMSLFTKRVQEPTERIAQFYFALAQLASKAFPRATKDQIDEHIRPRFIGGIRDGLIKVHLRGLVSEKNIKGSKLLESAVDMEDRSSDLRPAIKQLTFNNINTQSDRKSTRLNSSHLDVAG